MKKFKYKLDGLLKLRKFEEDKLKSMLGQINNEINKCNEEEEKLKKDVQEGFTVQESLLATGVAAHQIRYMPDFLIAKKNHLEQLANYKLKLLEKRLSLIHISEPTRPY